MALTRRWLNHRVTSGKGDSRTSIMDDPDDYARDLVAFLLDDSQWGEVDA